MFESPLRAWRSILSLAARTAPSLSPNNPDPPPSPPSLEQTLSELAMAVKYNEIEAFDARLKEALRLGAEQRAPFKAPAAVQLAFENNRLSLLERLLDAGADPNDAGLIPAIHRAVDWRDDSAIRLLARHGADLNRRDHHDRPPLIRACFNGHPAPAQALIDLGADLDALNGRNIGAISAAFESAVKIKRLVEQDPQDRRHQERYEEHLACVTALLKAGANPFIGSPSLSSISAAIDLAEPALASELLALCPRPDLWLINLSTHSRAPGSESRWANSLVRRYNPNLITPAKHTLEQIKNEARTLIESREISKAIGPLSCSPERSDRAPRL